jgi:hypothetical protein
MRTTNNRRVRLGCAVALAALLAGCESHGPSIGASGKESASSTTSAENADRDERSVSLSGSSKVSIPAFAIIAQGLLTGYKTDTDPSRMMLPAALDDDADGDVCKGFESWKDYTAAVEKIKANPQDPDALLTLHHIYRVPALWVLKAASGWEIDTFDRSDKGKLRTARYLAALMQSTVYANELFTQLAETVGQQALNDPDAAQAKVWAAYSALPWENLRAACHRAYATAIKAGGRVIGNGNFWFTATGLGAFEFDAGGVKWKRWGLTWFGEGRISGISRELSLASASTLTQTQSESASAQAKTEATTSASADTKTGK